MKAMPRIWIALLIGMTTMAPQMVLSHSAPERPRAFCGGIPKATEFFNLELLLMDGRISLFVRDRHNWPLDIRGFRASAKPLGQGDPQEISLMPDKRSSLTGNGEVGEAESLLIALQAPGRGTIRIWFDVSP